LLRTSGGEGVFKRISLSNSANEFPFEEARSSLHHFCRPPNGRSALVDTEAEAAHKRRVACAHSAEVAGFLYRGASGTDAASGRPQIPVFASSAVFASLQCGAATFDLLEIRKLE
jgi:hypothetical protein